MQDFTNWSAARWPFEYPDIAGYPDGYGTLDQGTRRRPDVDTLIIAELEGFMEGDARSA